MIPMTKRDALLKKLSTYQFAALDLQLFLDTHPNDENTIEKMNMFKKQASKAKEDYEKQFGPLQKSATDGNNWNWINGPWPWESEDDC